MAGVKERAVLVLEDGTVYHGYAFGARGKTVGEVVFNTAQIPATTGRSWS